MYHLYQDYNIDTNSIRHKIFLNYTYGSCLSTLVFNCYGSGGTNDMRNRDNLTKMKNNQLTVDDYFFNDVRYYYNKNKNSFIMINDDSRLELPTFLTWIIIRIIEICSYSVGSRSELDNLAQTLVNKKFS